LCHQLYIGVLGLFLLVRNKLFGPLLALSIGGCSGLETGISTGYGRFKDTELVPVNVHVGRDVNDVIGLDEKFGKIHVALEGFSYQFNDKVKDGSMSGVTPMGRYEFPLSPVSPYVEAGAGPGYLDFRTREQGHRGFNFLDQGGFGVIVREDGVFAQVGYRYMHISHGGTRDGPNKGIDSHIVLFGFGFRW
jgi:hypothetical protein